MNKDPETCQACGQVIEDMPTYDLANMDDFQTWMLDTRGLLSIKSTQIHILQQACRHALITYLNFSDDTKTRILTEFPEFRLALHFIEAFCDAAELPDFMQLGDKDAILDKLLYF